VWDATRRAAVLGVLAAAGSQSEEDSRHPDEAQGSHENLPLEEIVLLASARDRL
jgi:hypothetical protein